jgi:hypothetical protein
VAIVLGTDAIRGEFSNRSASGPEGSALADIRRHALSAFQTPGQDHRFIVAPCLRLSMGAEADCVLHAVYAVDADAVPYWIEEGHVSGIAARFDERHCILNADEADLFTHLSDAERTVSARNDRALREQREQLRRMASRMAGRIGESGIGIGWNNEVLSARYKNLEAAPPPVRLSARALTKRLLGGGLATARPDF